MFSLHRDVIRSCRRRQGVELDWQGRGGPTERRRRIRDVVEPTRVRERGSSRDEERRADLGGGPRCLLELTVSQQLDVQLWVSRAVRKDMSSVQPSGVCLGPRPGLSGRGLRGHGAGRECQRTSCKPAAAGSSQEAGGEAAHPSLGALLLPGRLS